MDDAFVPSPDWLGNPQHFVAGLLLVVVVCVYTGSRVDAPPLVVAAISMLITMGAEGLVELAEYFLILADAVTAHAYADTVADLAATLAGAILGATGWLVVQARRREG